MDNQVFSGKYEVQREIAKGGMGVIYHARDITLHREVVIKVLHPQFSSDPAFAQRFLREARAMARLDHPNIMRIYAVEEEHSSHYIVMEYSQGKDLKHLIREQEYLSISRALPITIQITKALAYAHQKGIVHRDIKPSNIMLVEQDQVKITDFGIAAALDESSVTMTGTVIGTPEYMSPEQARGEQVDARSDLYSLGIVAYEMFTGKTPYKGLPGPTIIGKLAFEPSDPILSFPQNIPNEVQDVIHRLIKKQQNERINDTNQIIETLNHYLSQSELQQSNIDPTVAFTKLDSERTQATRIIQKTFIDQPLIQENTPDVSEHHYSLPPVQKTRTLTRWRPILVGAGLLCLAGIANVLYQWPLSILEKKEIRKVEGQSHLQTQKTQTEGQGQRSKDRPLSIIEKAKTGKDKKTLIPKHKAVAIDKQRPNVTKSEQKHEKTEKRLPLHSTKIEEKTRRKTEHQRLKAHQGQKRLETKTTTIATAKQQAEIAANQRNQEKTQQLTALHKSQTKEKARAELERRRKEAQAQEEAERQRLAAEQAIQGKAAEAQRQVAEKLARATAERDQLLAALEAESKKTEQEKAERQRLIEELKKREQEDQQRRQAKAKAAAKAKQQAEITADRRKRQEAQRLSALHAAQAEEKARAELERRRKEAQAQEEAERQRLAAEQAIQTKAAEAQQQAEIALAKKKEKEAQQLATEKQEKAEILQVTALLNIFQEAYESQNLPTLQQITTMDEKRIQYLQLMFKSYSTIRVTTEIESINKQKAYAKLLITKLIDQKGKVIKPSPIIRETTITIPKEGEQWGNIHW